MKTKYITRLLSLVMLSALAIACDDLTDTNKNPNESLTSQPDYLLTNVIKSSADTYWGVEGTMNSTLLFVQHWSKIQYTDQDRYAFVNTDFESTWRNFYSIGISDLAEINRLAEESGNNNYKGVALILRSWIFGTLTDLYGAVPYRQTSQIQEYLTPAYDPQDTVYYGILKDLETGVRLLNKDATPISGDVLYKGDITRWIKFGNSLRLRYALRIADQAEGKAREVITALQGQPLISANADIAQLVYTSSPNQNPVAANFETRDDHRISATMVETLRSLEDPRLPVYARRTEKDTTDLYIGLPNGLTNAAASDWGLARTSKIGTFFARNEAPAILMSYAEVLFNLAESAARGFTADAPEALYNRAIEASLQQVNITDPAVINAYLSKPAVKYNADNFRQSIGNQKWIALFGQGIEAFTEWRRLDYPQLTPAVNGVLNGRIPLRFIYPGSEQSLNRQSYTNAVNAQGTDGLITRLWFDKQ